MIAVIQPHPLKGAAQIPCSKSYAHRLLIAAALSDKPTEVGMNALNEDILATASCLTALGAKIERTQDGFSVHPILHPVADAALFCGESGSTLRFMLPVAAMLGQGAAFTGAGRLPERPNAPLTDALGAHGVRADSDRLPIHLTGRLTGGRYPIAGNISSQYITGLMLALPLCDEDSDIILTTPLESASYIEITRAVLAEFGIAILPTKDGWHIPGGQHYASPGRIAAEGDWSGAAFWMAANALGGEVDCQGLNPASIQGDRAILNQIAHLGSTIDVSDTPDLVPALAVAAAHHRGTTEIVGAARLRIKESDRLRTVADMLTSLGGHVEEHPDGLTIHGGTPLTGGTVHGCNDHRIVMAAAIAAAYAEGPVTITDAQAVNKSYPAFFDTMKALGGLVHVEPDR